LPLNCFGYGNIIDNNNALLWQPITPASDWKSCVFNSLGNPSDQAITYTLLITGAAGSAHDYIDSTFPGCNYGTVSVPTTVDAIDEVKTLVASGPSATGTIIDNNNAPTVATITCFGY
jgi:hypothetical protein